MLVVGGSRQTPGVVRLAAVAALRSGAGKLLVASVKDVAIPLAITLPAFAREIAGEIPGLFY